MCLYIYHYVCMLIFFKACATSDISMEASSSFAYEIFNIKMFQLPSNSQTILFPLLCEQNDANFSPLNNESLWLTYQDRVFMSPMK